MGVVNIYLFVYFIEWPESVPVPPQVATISGFMTLFENNHLWLSHPFFTRKRVRQYISTNENFITSFI